MDEMEGKALHDFKASAPDELAFTKGSILKVCLGQRTGVAVRRTDDGGRRPVLKMKIGDSILGCIEGSKGRSLSGVSARPLTDKMD